VLPSSAMASSKRSARPARSFRTRKANIPPSSSATSDKAT
jgi:hypothetical protein